MEMATNSNKINYKQKTMLADFMSDHPDLAKGKLSNCPQGRSTSNRLWDQLTTKINTAGPPTKNVSMWRKVYADQKHQVKKKLSFNKASKKQTGGGPYEEKILTLPEEQILEAAGLNAAVEGLFEVECFGTLSENEVETIEEIPMQSNSDKTEDNSFTPGSSKPSRIKSVSKMSLLQTNLETGDEGRREQEVYWESLIEIKKQSLKLREETRIINESSLKIKEEEHATNMAINKVELEIKTLELEMLKQNLNL